MINSNCNIGEKLILHGNKGETYPTDVPTIEADVKLGFGVVIIRKVKVSKGTRISANSVDNKDVIDNNCIIGGVAVYL